MCESEQTGVSDMNLGLARENRCQEFRKFMQHPFLSPSFPTKLKRNPMSKDIIKNIYLMSGIREIPRHLSLLSLLYCKQPIASKHHQKYLYYLSNLTRTMLLIHQEKLCRTQGFSTARYSFSILKATIHLLSNFTNMFTEILLEDRGDIMHYNP